MERMHLAVCTPCQYDCVSCAHQAMRYEHANYQLSIGELREFLSITVASGYFVERLDLTGPGEPLIWKHLKEGLALIRQSPAIGRVEIQTNGLGIDRLDAASWACIDALRVSFYPEAAHLEPKLVQAIRVHGRKVIVNRMGKFRALPERGATSPIPCVCGCSGPMYFDKKVLLTCGPPVFDAARSKGVDVFDYPDMYRPVGPGYLESGATPRPWYRLAEVQPERQVVNHELCRYCFANNTIRRPGHAHAAFPPPS